MTDNHSFHALLHRATHRIPGTPTHAEPPAGHQGSAIHGRGGAPHAAAHHSRNHAPARPPRFMPSWQRRVAALFGREL